MATPSAELTPDSFMQSQGAPGQSKDLTPDDFMQQQAKPAPASSEQPDYGGVKPVELGNIKFYGRQKVPMPGAAGQYGTVYSASREENGQEVLYPQIYDGALHSDDEAWQHYKATGQHMGKFSNAADADRFAQKYHEDAAAGKYDQSPIDAAIKTVPQPKPPQMKTMPLMERQPGTSYQAMDPKADAAYQQQEAQKFTEEIGAAVPDAAVKPLAAVTHKAIEPFNKYVGGVGEEMGSLAEHIATGTPEAPTGSEASPGALAFRQQHGIPAITPEQEQQRIGEARKQHPLVTGIARSVGQLAGQTAADPRQWPLLFTGSAELKPLFAKLMSGGFAVQMGTDAAENSNDLINNWDKYTPDQRVEKIASTGLTSLFAAMSTAHAASPHGAPGHEASKEPPVQEPARQVAPPATAEPVAPASGAVEKPVQASENLNPDTFMQEEQNAVRPGNAQVQAPSAPVVERPASNQPQAGAGDNGVGKASSGEREAGVPAGAQGQEAQRPLSKVKPSRIELAKAVDRVRNGKQVAAEIPADLPKRFGLGTPSVLLDDGRRVAYNPKQTNEQTVKDHAAKNELYKLTGDQPPESKRAEASAAATGRDGQDTVPGSSEGDNTERTEPNVSKDVILARHGETKLDQKGAKDTVAGWTAEPLDERGKQSAAAMAEELKPEPVSHIVTSDLERAKQTAAIVGDKLGVPVTEDSRLRPQHTPETEGKQMGEAKPIHDYYVEHPNERPNGGETYNETLARQRAAISDAKAGSENGEKPVVLTHSRNIEAELGKTPEPGGVVIGDRTAKPRTPGEPLEHGFDFRPAEDRGQQARDAVQKTQGALPRGERRKIERTPDEQATQKYFAQARKELGEEATSDQVMARVGELKKQTTPDRIDSGRDKILESEIKHLKAQRDAVREKLNAAVTPGRYQSTDAHDLAKQTNELMRQINDREDELAKLTGGMTHAEKRDAKTKEAEKPFAERPQEPLTYGDTRQSQHWQVAEPDYIAKRFEDKIKSYERAVAESRGEVASSKAGSKKHADAEMNLKYRKDMLERYQAKDHRLTQSFKTEYTELIKKAVSQGKPVPQSVIDQRPEFKLAQDARERYEKGRHTSFANKSAAINDTMQKEEGFKVKRQDGKPITEAQMKEISGGVNDVVRVLGEPLRDAMRGTDLTIAHTSGKHPFLSDAGGMYHPVDRTVSAGIEDFLGRPVKALAHELGHWFDFESGRAIGVKSRIYTKAGKGHETQYASESDSSSKLYELARRTMSDTREVSRMLNLTKLSDLPDTERAEVERVKVVLGHYWREPRELFARMFEQYIADGLGKPSTAAETIERYQKTPAWWDKEAWAKLKPLMAQEITKRFDALKERYAPKEVTAPAPPAPAPAVETTAKTSPKVETITTTPAEIERKFTEGEWDKLNKQERTAMLMLRGYTSADWKPLREKSWDELGASTKEELSQPLAPKGSTIPPETNPKPRPAKGKREEIQPVIGATYKGRSNVDLPYTVLEVVTHDDWRGKQVRARTDDGKERTFSANGIVTGNDKLIKQPERRDASGTGKEATKPRVVPGARSARTGNETGTTSIQDLTDSIRRQVPDKRPLKDRLNRGAQIGEQMESAKDSVSRTYARIKGAASALWDAVSRPAPYTEYEDATGKWQGADQINAHDLMGFTEAIKKAVPDKLHREAISNWIEAGGDDKILRERAQKSQGAYKKGYEQALKLTDAEKTIARNVMNRNDATLEEAQKAGILQQGVENYVRHVYADDPKMQAKVNAEMNFNSLKTKPSFTKERKIPTYFDAEQLGFTPKDKDVGYLTAIHERSFREALAARAYIRSLMEGKAEDGRPLVQTAWSSAKEIDAKDGEGSAAYLVKPNIKAEEEYSDYRRIDHPALRGWRWAGKTDSGEPIFVQGDALVHPDIYAKLRNNLGRSAIRSYEMPIAGRTFHPGAAVLNVSAQVKHAILSFSGFHQTTLGMHALEHRTLPAGMPDLDLGDAKQRSLVEHGLMVAQYDAEEAFGEGVASGGIVTKVPGIGPLYGHYVNYLFHDYLPRVKMAVALNALDRNFERYGEKLKSGKITEDQVYRITSEQTNAAFGGLNYRMLGRNKTMQDVLRLGLMAPDFFEARARYTGQAAKPYGREQTAALLGGAVVLYTLGRLLNQALDDDPHWDKPFAIVHKGREYAMRTIQQDIFNALTDPAKYFMARLSPLVSTSIHLGEGRNQFGRKQSLSQAAKETAKSEVPIPLQPWVRKSHDSNAQKAIESIGKMVGVNVKKAEPHHRHGRVRLH